MKFRKLGQAVLAAVVSTGLMFGVTSCANDFTVGYVYVTGTQYNQIGAYREDNNNGDLKSIAGSPVGSGGSNPIRALIPSGGRFMYVLNAGVRSVDPTTNEVSYSGNNISVFSIGGYGQLSFQYSYATQGIGPKRIATDAAGTHLFVLDTYSPIGNATGTIQTASATQTASFPCQESTGVYRPTGDVSVFSIDTNTGRLSLVANQQQQNLTYFPVGCFPVDFRLTSTYLYTMDAGATTNSDLETVFVYNVAGTGQLTLTQNAPLPTGATAVDAISGDTAGTRIYLIDPTVGVNSSGVTVGTIFPFSIGSGGALTALNGGISVNSNSEAGNPQQLITVSGSPNTFLYLANAGPGGQTNIGNGDVSGYLLNSTTGHLDNPTVQSPYGGEPSGLVCIFEDPSNQFVYAAGSIDNSIAGRRLDPNTGSLTALRKGTAFPTVGTPSWCLSSSSNH